MKRITKADIIQIEPQLTNQELAQAMFNGELESATSRASTRLGLEFLFHYQPTSHKVEIRGFNCSKTPGTDLWYEALYQFMLEKIISATRALVSE